MSRIDRSQDLKSKGPKKPHVVPEDIPETLPELVMRLLDPIVKEEEEYQECVCPQFSRALDVVSYPYGIWWLRRYIEQGQELLVTSREEVDYRKPIYLKYRDAIKLAQGTAEPMEFSEKDEKIVLAYMDRGSAQDSDAGYTSTNYEKIIQELTLVD